MDASGIRGHGHDGDDPPLKTRRCSVGGIVTDHNRRARLAGLRAARRIEADIDNLAAVHSASQAVSSGRFPGSGII